MKRGQRVIDLHDYSKGTVVASFGRSRFQVAWDEATPYEQEARPVIPSEHFAFERDVPRESSI